MRRFEPQAVMFESKALDYPLGRRLHERFSTEGVAVSIITSHNRVTGIRGTTPRSSYLAAKRTLVVGVKRDLRFAPCRPSADYQLVTSTGCPGMCHYCYLSATMGTRPYVRVYVNVDQILGAALGRIAERAPGPTTFEASATSDPVAVEHITGTLFTLVEFFADQPLGFLRFVTKSDDVDSLLGARHNGHTRFRFSLNTPRVIASFEGRTAGLDQRLGAMRKAAASGYPVGVVLAPIMVYEGWRPDYLALLDRVAATLPEGLPDLTFELITFRFTPVSRKVILERFPGTRLDLDPGHMAARHGRYGRLKYVYPHEQAAEVESFLRESITRLMPGSRVDYFV